MLENIQEQIVIVFEFDQVLDIQDSESIYINVWSDVAKEVILSLQDAAGSSGSNVYNSTQNHSGSGSWEILEFNYAGLIPSNVNITQGVLLFAPDETGTAYEFFYDDIRKGAASQVGLDEQDLSVKIINNKIYFTDQQDKQVEIFDVMGRKMDAKLVTNNYSIDNKGLLFINIIYLSGKNQLIKHIQF